LSGVSLPQLEHLLQLVRDRRVLAPLTRTALIAHGLGPSWNELAWLGSLDQAGLEGVLGVAIAERTTRPVPRLELVWTGPEAKVSAARDTAVVLRELFTRAERSVIVAGFSFSSGQDIFAPLHVAMRDRGVDARMFLHIDDRPGMSPEESARDGVAAFLADNWPFGDPTPLLYYDPRTVALRSSINLHAKCVVVDQRWALVGSANFTHNAHVRNIEAGVLIEDVGFAIAMTQQWDGLVSQGLVSLAST
jgi:phosphatidylserine/phosphatidylglycerophosphate/cardiolipin synthase-like enzyme